jgi:hypothetical protein
VGFTDLVTPVTATDWNDRELGEDDGSADSGGDFLAALNSQTDVTVAVTDGDEGLEAGALTGTGLLLDGHDLQDLVLQGAAQEEIDDFALFDWERVQVDFLQRTDLSVAHQTAELGDWNPFLLVSFLVSATTSTASATLGRIEEY